MSVAFYVLMFVFILNFIVVFCFCFCIFSPILAGGQGRAFLALESAALALRACEFGTSGGGGDNGYGYPFL